MTRDDYLPWGIVHKIMVVKEMTSSSSEHAVLLLFMSTIATITEQSSSNYCYYR